jgi:hypothetical protein
MLARNIIETRGQDAVINDLVWEVNRMRYAIMSVEMLFIALPLRHNFALHRIEM